MGLENYLNVPAAYLDSRAMAKFTERVKDTSVKELTTLCDKCLKGATVETQQNVLTLMKKALEIKKAQAENKSTTVFSKVFSDAKKTTQELSHLENNLKVLNTKLNMILSLKEDLNRYPVLKEQLKYLFDDKKFEPMLAKMAENGNTWGSVEHEVWNAILNSDKTANTSLLKREIETILTTKSQQSYQPQEIWDRIETHNKTSVEKQPKVSPESLRPGYTDLDLPLGSAVKFTIGGENRTWLHASNVAMQDNEQYVLTQHPGYPDKDFGNNAAYFWQMCGQQDISTVIDLSQPTDANTSSYYPVNPGVIVYKDHSGNNTMVMMKKPPIEKDGVKIYQLEINIPPNKETKVITRVHFTEWKDFSEADGAKILKLIRLVDGEDMATGRTCVHCRGGVGRSGTFTVLRTVKHLIENGEINKSNYSAKLLEIIKETRDQRGTSTVQTEAQVQMLYDTTEKLLGIKR